MYDFVKTKESFNYDNKPELFQTISQHNDKSAG